MTILHSCCCWRSVRKGSFACGIYTGLYYTLNAAQTSILLHEEFLFLKNISSESLIDHNITSETSIVFSALILVFSSCGLLTTFLLFFGLYKNTKILLVPWIFNIAFFSIVDVIYLVYNLIVHALQWNPSVAILITIDFFLNALNMYAFLCVISQYQEYKAGRGRACDDLNIRVPNIQYSSQPTATSYLSSRKAVTYFETRPTPTQSPTKAGPDFTERPSAHFNRGPRKSVKFPDQTQNGAQLLEPWTIEAVKSPVILNKKNDLAPLLQSESDKGSEIVRSSSDL